MALDTNKFSLIRISSEDKNNPNDNNASFKVNLIASGGNIAQVTRISVKSIYCPNVFYNVNQNNNVLVFKDSGSVSNKTITLAVGQYNVNQLISALQTEMNSLITAGSVVITLNPLTQILTFTSTTVTIQFLYDLSTMTDIVGLSQNSLNNLVVTMDSMVNLTGETEVYIHSKTLAISRLIEANGTFSVVGYISLADVPFGSIAKYQANDEELDTVPYIAYGSARTLQEVDITLRDRVGNVLNLPNNFYFSMVLQAYYK